MLAVFFGDLGLLHRADLSRRHAAQAAGAALIGGVAGAGRRAAHRGGVHRTHAASVHVGLRTQLGRVDLLALTLVIALAAVVVRAGARCALLALAAAFPGPAARI